MEREREPGDPGIPYDPDAPDRLIGRSASDATPSTPAPYSPGPRPRSHWRGWVGGGLVVAGLIGLMSFASGNGDDDGDAGSRASVVAVPESITSIRIQTTSDDVRLDHSGQTARQVTVDDGSARNSLDGNVLVLRPEDDATLSLPTGIPVEVRTTSGDVDGEDLDLPGLTVRSTSGDVDLEWTSVPSSVDVQTTSGSVDVALPEADYDVTTETSSGDEDVARRAPGALNKVHVQTSSGDITVED